MTQIIYRGIAIVNESARYIKIVEWPDEDHCFVGQCPGVIGPCCHGSDEAEVYSLLCQIVDEWLETLKKRWQAITAGNCGNGELRRELRRGRLRS